MTTGQSYLDPAYDRYEVDAAQKAGIDPALLRAIRTRGERSNADQVSSAGARSVYQIIPQTRDGIIRNHGFDPYASPQNAALGAAMILKEGLQRNHGDVQAAVGEYHGGIDRRNWGPVNAAYRARVAGRAPDGQMPSVYGQTPTAAGAPAGDIGDDALAAYGISAATPSQKMPRIADPGSFASMSPAIESSTPRIAGGVPDYSGWIDNYLKTIVDNA
ncbi:Transglycosylase SLT domain-containing protein [Burkholderia sp. GAS332]|nr:Transglycosylase SLT domain-containing protein [Burkholderia sp. GAS332]